MTALLLPGETLTLGVNVIVRPGDRLPYPRGTGNATATWVDPPQDWVALTGPCPTCDGSCHRGVETGFATCLDCRDGRRIVPLYTVRTLDDGMIVGTRLVGRGSIAVVPVSESLTDPAGLHIWWTGALYLLTNGDPQYKAITLSLDPLPVPGRDFGIVIDCVEVAS